LDAAENIVLPSGECKISREHQNRYVIRGDLVYRCGCQDRRLGFTIRNVHTRDGQTGLKTASNINTCQCRCDTSRDDTWTLISRCNITCREFGREGVRSGSGRKVGRQTARQINKGASVRYARARYSVQSRSTNEGSVYQDEDERKTRRERDNVNERPL
jgi:hypothetical protein